ncbi:MAG: RagB/SusD family nutrient uptake outer membrane protein [Bacteroidetes bacterium]|nr:RagB/SusD family nutrient uptake outer membrane protein [Bacteroidota bacterium]
MNRNKYLFFLLIGMVGMVTIPACTDLEVAESDSVVVESSGGFTAGNPTDLLSSAYNDLGDWNDQANLYSLYEHVTDEMLPPTRGVDWGDNGVWRTLHQHTWDATHSGILNTWNNLNSHAYKCNQILASNPSPEEAAQAKFLRAFYMYHVMDLWGQVPFREVTEGVDVNPRVLTRTEAFDFIINDLNEALPMLPNQGPSADIAVSGKASKASANALLARLYLNKAVYTNATPEGPYKFENADMDKVIGYCDAIEGDGYSLEDEYFTNFSTSASKEIIFEVPTGSAQNRWFMTLHYNQNPSGWNGFTTIAEFYDKFEAQDQRIGNYPTPDGTEFSGIGRGFLIGQQYNDDGSILKDTRSQLPLVFSRDVPLSGAATEKGIRAIKWHPSNAGQIILMRWAEFMLDKAEAMMRKGDSAGALALVNELRSKRGASALGALDEPTMLDERGREMYWEGFRRVDQVRFGTFSDTWSEKTVTEPFRVLYPIPQQALDSNPNLSQNAGY